MILAWFHKLLNPHCEHCKKEEMLKHEMDLEIEREVRACKSCDILKIELEKTQRINEQLLSKLLDKPVETIEPAKIEGSARVGKPIMSWTARRQILEAESRDAARKLSEKQKELSVEDIEKELGVSDASQ